MRTVSVIIPALNEQDGIVAAIDSAMLAGAAQVIVVDGGSRDRTVELANEAGALVLCVPPGRAAQQNAGAAIATCDVLLFLHADCQLHQHAIRRLNQWLDQSDLHIAGGFTQRINDPRWRFRYVEFGNAMRGRWLKWIYGDQAIFVLRSVFQDVGGFPALRFMEDLFLSRILRRHGRTGIVSAPVTVSARRWQLNGVLRQTLRNWWLIIQALAGRSPDDLARYYSNHK